MGAKRFPSYTIPKYPWWGRAQFNLGFLISIVRRKRMISRRFSLFHLFLAFEARRSLALGVKNHNFPMKTRENRTKKAKNPNERDRDGAMGCVAQDTWLLWLFYIVLLQSLLNRVGFSKIVHFLLVRSMISVFGFFFKPRPSEETRIYQESRTAIIFGLSRERWRNKATTEKIKVS